MLAPAHVLNPQPCPTASISHSLAPTSPSISMKHTTSAGGPGPALVKGTRRHSPVSKLDTCCTTPIQECARRLSQARGQYAATQATSAGDTYWCGDASAVRGDHAHTLSPGGSCARPARTLQWHERPQAYSKPACQLSLGCRQYTNEQNDPTRCLSTSTTGTHLAAVFSLAGSVLGRQLSRELNTSGK